MKTIRPLHVEAKVLSAENHTVRYTASDQTLDCYGDIILARGWKFTNFAKNAPFVDSHDYSSIEKLLGSVIDFKVTGDTLTEDVQWAADVPENKLACLGWKMTVSGHLKAVSVGFFPVKASSKFTDNAAFLKACNELNLDPSKMAKLNTIYHEQEQIELSACVIGANPNALAKAHTDGAVSDADLDSIGFTDEDMTVLHECAAVYDRLTVGARAMLDHELRAIPFRKAKQLKASQANGPGAARDAIRREHVEFLRKFNAVTQNVSST